MTPHGDSMVTLPYQTHLTRIAIGAYLLWLVAIILYMAGRYTPFPLLQPARTGMIAGAVLVTLFGAVRIFQRVGTWYKLFNDKLHRG